MDQIQRRGKTGAILAARTFEHKGPGRLSKASISRTSMGWVGSLRESSMASRWAMPRALSRAGFVLPPGQIVIAAAQIDQRLDAASFQKGSYAAGPGLGGAGAFARHHPVEIVENIAQRSHS